jgi:hypothetical protein
MNKSPLRAATLALLAWMGCGEPKEPVTPKPEPTAASSTPEPAPQEAGADPLHAALVETHRHAVEECFGGFGKGAPYSADLVIDGGSVTEAKIEGIGEGYGKLPSDCIAKHFKAMSPPGDSTHVRARFAVNNPDCPAAECPETDLPCHFKRDIACSVVVDER